MESLLWMSYAACQDTDLDLWFPPPDYPPTEAVAICDECPVRVECLDYAVRHDLTDGVWGGLSAHKRKQIKAGKAA